MYNSTHEYTWLLPHAARIYSREWIFATVRSLILIRLVCVQPKYTQESTVLERKDNAFDVSDDAPCFFQMSSISGLIAVRRRGAMCCFPFQLERFKGFSASYCCGIWRVLLNPNSFGGIQPAQGIGPMCSAMCSLVAHEVNVTVKPGRACVCVCVWPFSAYSRVFVIVTVSVLRLGKGFADRSAVWS